MLLSFKKNIGEIDPWWTSKKISNLDPKLPLPSSRLVSLNIDNPLLLGPWLEFPLQLAVGLAAAKDSANQVSTLNSGLRFSKS